MQYHLLKYMSLKDFYHEKAKRSNAFLRHEALASR